MKKYLLLVGFLISAIFTFAQEATLRAESVDVTGYTPGDKVYVPIYCDAITDGEQISGFQFFFEYDKTVLDWDGTLVNPLPGVINFHPNFAYSPSDWIFNETNDWLLAQYIFPGFFGGADIEPGESFFTWVFTYTGGTTEINWVTEGLFQTEMYDGDVNFFDLDLIAGCACIPCFDVTFHVTSGGVDVEGALITIGAESMLTDINGMAVFCLVNGSYSYLITKEGFNDKTGNFAVNNAPVNLNPVLFPVGTEFPVTFHVTSGGGDLEGALITVGSETALTNSSGIAVINLPNGDFDYTVTKYGYEEETGSFTVNSAPLTIDVDMTMLPHYTVTFHVTSGGADIENALVQVTGIGTMMTNTAGLADFSLVDGDYNWTVTKTGFVTANGSVTVAGSDVTVDVELVALWTVTFHVTDEMGANLVSAEVEVNGVVKFTNANGIATYMLPDDDYDYTVSYPQYITQTGNFTVAGGPVNIEVQMMPDAWTVTFHVTSGGADIEGAAVDIAGEIVLTDADGIAVFMLTDGDYDFTVTKSGFVTFSDFFQVSGAPVNIEVVLQPMTYLVTFHVTSPTGSNLSAVSITVDGYAPITTNTNGIATINLPNGTHNYTATKPNYVTATGDVTVAGGPVTEEVVLAPVTYPVTFEVTAYGAPLEGATVTVSGQTPQITPASGIVVFNLTTGTKTWTVSKTGYITENGPVNPTGPTTIPVDMELQPYPVTIHVTSGAFNIGGAEVTINGVTLTTGTNGIIVFNLINGNYSALVEKDGYESQTVPFTVANAALTVNVNLVQIVYDITFHVTSSATGEDLEGVEVEIGATAINTNAQGIAVFELPNGTYNYVASLAGYLPDIGNFTVNNAAQTIEVELDPVTYAVTFTVTSQGSPVSGATVTINGDSQNTPANGVVVFDLPNGTYDWEVTHPSYEPQSDVVTVNNGPVNVPVVLFTGVSESGSSSFSLYPNPSNGKVYISTTQYAGFDTEVVVYDFTGNVVIKERMTGNEVNMIDLSAVESGVYLLKITVDNRTFNETVIIK